MQLVVSRSLFTESKSVQFPLTLVAAIEGASIVEESVLVAIVSAFTGAAILAFVRLIFVLKLASVIADENFVLYLLNFCDAAVLFILSFNTARSCNNTALIAGSVVLVSASL